MSKFSFGHSGLNFFSYKGFHIFCPGVFKVVCCKFVVCGKGICWWYLKESPYWGGSYVSVNDFRTFAQIYMFYNLLNFRYGDQSQLYFTTLYQVQQGSIILSTYIFSTHIQHDLKLVSNCVISSYLNYIDIIFENANI